jgi:protoporphyrin/coproporphyrin ferrochelatase
MIGVVLGQVGTPDAPTPAAVRRYLARFLSDRRVVDYPPILWQPLLRGVILPLRARRSARLYQRIWTPEGSPLLTISVRQKTQLQAALGSAYQVELAMAYAGPSPEAAFEAFARARIERVVVLPMFPQYSSTTSASIYDAVQAAANPGAASGQRFVPALTFIPPCFERDDYISALCACLRTTIAAMTSPPDHVVITFHGLPKRYVETGDPYRDHCGATVRALEAAMQWKPRDYTVCFQSRFGPEQWLGPDTASTLTGLHARGIHRPLVFAPGFTTDCLETLDELGHEGRAQFAAGGGRAEDYTLCPCLNDSAEWIDCMARLIRSA